MPHSTVPFGTVPFLLESPILFFVHKGAQVIQSTHTSLHPTFQMPEFQRPNIQPVIVL
jgi:hypothetical protein